MAKLPNYKGSLRAAPWSEIRLTEESRESLRRAAARGCVICGAAGYLGKGLKVQICVCVNRRTEETA
jgi:hypothetical protein